MRRAPTRRSEDQIPQRDAVQRPAQHPVTKQPIRPSATAKKIPGAAASKTRPTGKSHAYRLIAPTSGKTIRNPSTAHPPPTNQALSGFTTLY